MTVYIAMQAPTTWPFLTPIVPAHLMPSGNAYRPDASGQIQANQADVGALAGYGFTLPGSKFPSITDTGTLVTIAADSKITGSLDVAEHLHFHESVDPGTPNAGGVIFADTSDHKLKYTFHDGTTTDLAPTGGGGSSPFTLILSSTIASPQDFIDITLPPGYKKWGISYNNWKLGGSSQSRNLAAAFSYDGGSSFLCDTTHSDTYGLNLLTWNGPTANLAQSVNIRGSSHWDNDSLLYLGYYQHLLIDGTVEIWPGDSDFGARIWSVAYTFGDDADTITRDSPAWTVEAEGWVNPFATSTPPVGVPNLIRLLPYGLGDATSASGDQIVSGTYSVWGQLL